MPDQPVIITGGSLRIENRKGKLKDKGDNGKGGNHYEHPEEGTITGVTIDGKPYPAQKNSVITIHYEVP
jgi:hypothetical protein